MYVKYPHVKARAVKEKQGSFPSENNQQPEAVETVDPTQPRVEETANTHKQLRKQ